MRFLLPDLSSALKPRKGLLESVDKSTESVTATPVSAILLLTCATTTFGELQAALGRQICIE
ncbi:MAG: hypothetical protein HHJ12_17160 [Glaciimonas sp.]|nr:hypothetical protein [Glaciimonas sp.]